MRTFELLITAAVLGYLLWLSFGNGLPGSKFRWIPVLAAGLSLTQVLVEGVRWQMYPLYVLVALMLALYPWCRSHGFRIRLRFLAGAWAGMFILLGGVGITGGVLWPAFAFERLTGPYAVGCFSAHLLDQGRRDPYSPAGLAVRELMVEVWYPAEQTRGFRQARYRDGRRTNYQDSSLALVETRSFFDAPLAKARAAYPAVLFSGPFNRFQNTFETEELASQGFIVIGIDHPYDSDLVVFPDGRRVFAGEGSVLLVFTSEAALAVSRKAVERRLAVRVADVRFVLDQLQRWNNSEASKLHGHIDLARIGIIGHSFGGAVAAEICRTDRRVRAGVNMDGSMFGTAKVEGVPTPFFFMFDATPRPSKTELEAPNEKTRLEARELKGDYDDIDRSMSRYGGYFFQVPGLEHLNYSDYSLYSQLKAWSGAGAIGVRRAHVMINRVTLAFFRRELLGDHTASVEASLRDFPEAVLRRQPGPVHGGSGQSIQQMK